MSGYDWTRRLDAELPDLLEDLAAPRVPEYADVIFERLATAPQRSRWTFAGRWLPAPVARHRVPKAPVASWRLIVVGLVVLALAAAAIVAVGSRPRVPPPFGLASPGAIGYVADGRIWLAGPDGSGAHPISADGGNDVHPVFSPDGTKLAFVRLATPGSHANWEEWGSVIVMDTDGGHPSRRRRRSGRHQPVHLVGRWAPAHLLQVRGRCRSARRRPGGRVRRPNDHERTVGQLGTGARTRRPADRVRPGDAVGPPAARDRRGCRRRPAAQLRPRAPVRPRRLVTGQPHDRVRQRASRTATPPTSRRST